MAQILRRYELGRDGTHLVEMPRRARIITVAFENRRPCIHALIEETADTKAFDRPHQRQFAVLTAGSVAPDGAGYIGSCFDPPRSAYRGETYHVFEMRSGRG